MSEHYLVFLKKERFFELEDSHILCLKECIYNVSTAKLQQTLLLVLDVTSLVQGKEVIFYLVLVTSYIEYYFQF